jgi:hypothetical protein
MSPPLQDHSGWHPWFAWHPVRIDGYLRWLRAVERRECWGDDVLCYEYRELIGGSR